MSSNRIDGGNYPDGGSAPVTRSWLLGRISAAIDGDPGLGDLGLRPLPGLAAGPVPPGGPLKAYWGVSCECSTSAVLSVEVSPDRTREDVVAALPALLGRLKLQANSFRDMPCDAHARLRVDQFGSEPGPP
jgi:hypothetical protein